MSDQLTELALLTAGTSDSQSQMMVAEVHDEMEDSYWMASLRASLSGNSYPGRTRRCATRECGHLD